jgi:DNA-binding NtrC family response regulator
MMTDQEINKRKSVFIDMKTEHSILIVDDEKIIREGLVRALSRSYKTYQAANGKEAIDIVNTNSDIKVIVSDMNMPEVDGLEMLDMIQNENRKVDVIFVTGSSPIELAVDAMKKGAFDYMTKPVDLGKLETTIQNAIENKGI